MYELKFIVFVVVLLAVLLLRRSSAFTVAPGDPRSASETVLREFASRAFRRLGRRRSLRATGPPRARRWPVVRGCDAGIHGMRSSRSRLGLGVTAKAADHVGVEWLGCPFRIARERAVR
jgi:hypothetical protein